MTSEADLFKAVERFGQTLEAAGMNRMASRVFAYVLAEDRDHYTAAELAEGLHVSAAAVSGAVRYLVEARLLVRERRPGRRGDVYRVIDGDIWTTITAARIPMLDHFVTSITEAMELLDPGSPGRARLQETRDFFEFSRQDMAGLLDRWQAWQAEQP